MGILRSADIMSAVRKGRNSVNVAPATVITPLARETAESYRIRILENLMRKPFMAGNWKMNKTNSEAVDTVTALKELLVGISDVDVLVAPPFTALALAANVVEGSGIEIGAQNLHHEESGAYTGEISASMLKSSGCRYVIIGHSERRQYFGCTDELVNKKIHAAVRGGLAPIVCVGELLRDREENRTFDVLSTQLSAGLKGLSEGEQAALTIAYEPVWAIGTGRTASPDQAQEAHRFIRGVVSEMYGEEVAQSVRILYGGSVKPDNVSEIMQKEDVDGALVGGASLDARIFSEIVRFKS